MATAPPARGGLLTSLKRLTGSALELVQVRLALLATELEAEKLRLIDGFLWAAMAFLLLGVGLVLFALLVLLLFWDSYRVAALVVLTLLFLGSGVALAFRAYARLRSPQGWFSHSRAELARDLAALREPR